ncbi:MAG: hypothetical protein ABIZ80_10260 [Bryobacteraceae bacterium]
MLVEELSDAAGAAQTSTYRSLQSLAGHWQDDPEFDRALEDQRQIDWALWR